MVIDFHPEARAEAIEARKWYNIHSIGAGQRFQESFNEAMGQILKTPDRWPAGISNTRFLTLKRFPYQVVYRPRVGSILIIAVAHTSRRPGYWKNRLKS